MDADLKCNRLTCRRALADKAVVTTCSHIFCIECANELFNAARLCPACETSLSEPDDVVICSLSPTNDYKTSVLSGLSPSIILEICSRAISFWQYQIHQEHAFQQAVVRNMNDKNAQMQKQFENVVREANGEINLLNDKNGELQHDLEKERRKVRELQESSRERDKGYQKLKAQYDKIKRKALLGSNSFPDNIQGTLGTNNNGKSDHANVQSFNSIDIGTVVGNMETNHIQRTPIGVRNAREPFPTQQNHAWVPQSHGTAQGSTRNGSHRQQFGISKDWSHRSGNISDRSESANEVEDMLITENRPLANRTSLDRSGWGGQRNRAMQRVFAPVQNKKTSNGFRPAGLM